MNAYICRILVGGTALVMAGVPLSGAGMDVVKDGQVRAVIVAQRASANIERGRGRKSQAAGARESAWNDQTAANVLADWIEKIADVRPAIVNRPQTNKAAIYVGAAAINAGLDLSDIDSPTKEGLHIVCDGKDRILIAGQNATSTVKAVCRFLEELGCRYFMDNRLGEVYPKSRTITVGPLNITEKPGLMLRKIWGSQWTGQSLWKIWNGAGGTVMATGHAWARYVDENLFETHPEYFALRDGRRKKGAWYCTSNPELRKVFAEGVISKGGSNPSVSPPDGTGYCQCERCLAQDDPCSIEPSSNRPSVTNRYVDFLDEVACTVGKAHPEWLLSFYCYADYTQPPTLNRRRAPNLVAWIAPIRYSRFHRIGSPSSPGRMQLAKAIDNWAAAAERIAYRTYNYNLAECLVPFSKLSVWRHDIPYLKAKGCIGINLESLVNWEIYGPHLYQSIRLGYAPDADSDAMMDDYFMKFYGPRAGPLMKQYWLTIDEAFANMQCESGSFYALHLVYTPERLKELSGLVQRASDITGNNEAYSARVAMTAQGLQNAAQYIRIRNAMNKGDFATAKRTYDQLYARNELEESKGYGTRYTLAYLKRFLGTHILAGAEAVAPPNRLLQVLPDRMKLTYDPADEGMAKGYHRPDFDDSKWMQVATYSNTLNAQGRPDIKSILWYRTSIACPTRRTNQTSGFSLFFTEVDGQAASVYVNGHEVASLGAQARRKPFEVDVTNALKAGRNIVAIKVDHTKITELSLGGIVRPILLIEKTVPR
ncbi:MAG: DUF4838 domain-containing protein [Phycisphaerales bacterium]|nr:MAG: DUF4838 domain-containing protein [Phycisphaerales bacterium]